MKAGYYAQACFVAQQVGEKALKALAHFKGADLVKSHSVTAIAKSLNINGDIEKMGKKLDLYYISTRYPDAVPSGAPFEYFTEEQASEAVAFGRRILKYVREIIEE